MGDGGTGPTSQVEVSTLTPVLNEERHISETVAALQEQDFPGRLEFLFVDGRSTDATRRILEELAREDERIRILDNPARHTATALNIALRAARGDYIARIDAHAVYPHHYLSRGVERLRRGDVAWVAGPQVPVGRDAWSRRIALALGSPLATGGSNRWASDVERHGRADGEVELATGVFTGVCRRDVLERQGGWNEGWPINQDSELAARVRKAGGRIVSLPELAATYTPRSSLRGLARQYWRYGMYRAKTALRHPETMRPTHVAMPALVLTSVFALAAPRRARRASWAVLVAYATGVAAGSTAAARAPADAVTLPLVFGTMHGAWGAGFLVGLARFATTARRADAPA
jgi:succinoglycan biosynthesis protein ExoA